MQRAMLRSLNGQHIMGWMAALLLTLTFVNSAQAIVPQVRDEGKFFSPGAIQQANDQIQQIKNEFKKDLVIETFDAPPAGQNAPTDTAGKESFFTRWLEQRAQQTGADGIVVLICRHPGHVQVGAGKNTQQRIFTTSNTAQLQQMIANRFRDKQYDAGLADGISYVRSTMQANGAGQAAPARSYGNAPAPVPANNSARAPTGSSHTCLWAFVVVIVIFVVIRIFSGMAGRNTGGGYGGGGYQGGPGYGGGGGYQGGPGYGGGGGGGFMKGMLGGILGGAAGSWLYDRFNRPDSSSTNSGNTGGGYQQPQGYTDSSQQSDQGQGFGNSSGGDFDSGSSSSASSGSDFDSGSSSSYDSGGGGSDFGGSSDSGSSSDSGGGSGDF